MSRKRFAAEQIIDFLREAEAGCITTQSLFRDRPTPFDPAQGPND